MSHPLVSFVTPFYNTEAYLQECIESVLRQTYDNWEYVLLNNCSTDRSLEIAEKYSQRFPDRVRLEHNSALLPQVQNYNQVFRFISPKSEYCKYIQADDWLFPECTAKMVEVAEAHPRVGIVASYQLDGDYVQLDGLKLPSPEVPGRDICRRHFLQDQYFFGTPTSLLIRSEIVRSRDPFYDENLSPFEDAHVCFDLLKTWNFGFVHQVLTFSRRDNESIISRIRQFSFLQLSRLQFAVLHGKDYLNREEFEMRLRLVERDYFLYLAKCALKVDRKDDDFWEFHKKGLATIHYKLNRRLLARWLPRALVEKVWDGFWARVDHGLSNRKRLDQRAI